MSLSLRPRLPLAWTAAATLALACADFSLPSRPQSPAEPPGPVITALTPARAFAGQAIAVAGTGFAGSPDGNLVIFNGRSIHAEGFTDEGHLLVRVPEDIRDGPVSVVTTQGTSPAFGQFEYLGLGHPRRNALYLLQSITSRPSGVLVTDDEIFVASETLRAVLDRYGRRVFIDGVPVGPYLYPDGSKLLVGVWESNELFEVGLGPSGLADRPDSLPPPPLLQLPGKKFVGVVEPLVDAESAMVLQVSDADSVELVNVNLLKRTHGVPFDLGLTNMEYYELSQDGRWLLVTGGRGAGEEATWGVLALDLTKTPYARHWIPDPPEGHGGPLTLVGNRALIPLTNGDLAQLDLSGPTPVWSPGRIEAFHGQVVGALSAATGPDGKPFLLALIPPERRLVAIDLAGRRLWSAPASTSAGAGIYLDEEAHRLYVIRASGGSVIVIDYWAGQLVDEITFLLGLGSTSDAPGQGVAYDARPPARVLVPSRNAGVLLSVDAESLEINSPIPLGHRSSPAKAVAVSPEGTIWVLHERELGFVGPGDREVIVATDLVSKGQRLAFASDGSVLVGMNEAVARFKDGRLQAGPRFPDGFLELMEAQGDEVLILWSQLTGNQYRAAGGRWKLTSFGTGAGPTVPLPDTVPEDSFLGALRVGGAPRLFMLRYPTGSETADVGFNIALGPSLELAEPQRSSVRFPAPVAATPDGRRLLWANLLDDDGLVHFADTEVRPGEVVDVGALKLPGPLCGAAFDTRGERAFVPVCGTDELAIIE